MRIFVAGATGVLGRRAVPHLIKVGHEVTGVARSSAKAAWLRDVGASPVEADLFDLTAVKAAAAGHQAVANLATHIPPPSAAMRASAWAVNERLRREASRNLVDAALAVGARRYIQESFFAVYGGSAAAWISEETAVRSDGMMDAALAAEAQATRFASEGGAGVALRFAFFIAPEASHIRHLVRWVRRGLAPSIGRPDDYISSITAEDAGAAVAAALNAPAGVYNVGDDEPLTRREYVDSLAEALGVRRPLLPPAWLGRIGPARRLATSLRLSNARLKEATGWAPKTRRARDAWLAVAAAMSDD